MTTRRNFLRATAGISAGIAVGAVPTGGLAGAPAVLRRRIAPVAVASGNGLEDSAYLFERNRR